MTTFRAIPPPPEIVEMGLGGAGFWFRFDAPDAHAIIHWKGGPKSPDHDVILHWIEATPKGTGIGSALLEEICTWADLRKLNLSCLVEQELVAWYGRHGFIRQEARYGEVIMGRSPKPVIDKLIVPGVS